MLFTYICLAIGGCLVLLVTLMFGGGHDADLHVDVGGMDIGHDVDHGDGGSEHSWFSVKVISAFATAFGAGGAIVRSFHGSIVLSLVIALAFGLLIAVVADAIIGLFYRQQASSSYSIADLAGKTGTVTLPILPGGTGEVRVSLGSTSETFSARSQDASGINQGDSVVVISPGPPMIVKKAS